MNCREADRKINGFINKTLTFDEMEAFIRHIRSCPACYEELETYYTIHYGLEFLDHDKPIGNMDVSRHLEEELSKQEKIIKAHYRNQHLFYLSLIIVSVVLILMVCLQEFGPREGNLMEQLTFMLSRIF